jgi:hypothetical protein
MITLKDKNSESHQGAVYNFNTEPGNAYNRLPLLGFYNDVDANFDITESEYSCDDYFEDLIIAPREYENENLIVQ